MLNWIAIKFLSAEYLPSSILSYFDAFRETFDSEALSLLNVETYMLFFVCLYWVTLGLIKTANAQGADIAYLNGTTKYTILFVLVGALILAINRNFWLEGEFYLLNDIITIDRWVGWAQVGILVLSIIFVLMTAPQVYTRNSYYYELMLFTLTVVILIAWLVTAWNFIVFYLILEGISLVFYTIATRTFSYGGVESALKYYSLGALASVILLVGILCVFAATGSADFLVVGLTLKATVIGSNTSLLLIIGLVLIALAVFFKLSAFPGHVWTPDVYMGTTLEVLWVFAILAKFTFFILFLRFFSIFYFTPLIANAINFWIATSCVGSLLIGAAGAFLATNVKRFVAYTAINQIGFLFIGLATLSADGIKSTVTYLYIYMLANVLFFCVITLLQSKKFLIGDISLRSLKDIALLKKAPVEIGLLAISLLSLGGLPPLAGFAGKYLLWSSLLSQYLQTSSSGLAENLLYILVISVILSLLSTFYYLRLIKIALFDNFDGSILPVFDLRNSGDIAIASMILGILGFVTVGWFLILADLDTIWTSLTLAVIAPLGA